MLRIERVPIKEVGMPGTRSVPSVNRCYFWLGRILMPAQPPLLHSRGTSAEGLLYARMTVSAVCIRSTDKMLSCLQGAHSSAETCLGDFKPEICGEESGADCGSPWRDLAHGMREAGEGGGTSQRRCWNHVLKGEKVLQCTQGENAGETALCSAFWSMNTVGVDN